MTVRLPWITFFIYLLMVILGGLSVVFIIDSFFWPLENLGKVWIFSAFYCMCFFPTTRKEGIGKKIVIKSLFFVNALVILIGLLMYMMS